MERGGLGLGLVQGCDPLGPQAGPSGGTPCPLCGVGVPMGMAGVAGDTEVGGVSWPLSGVHWGLPGDSGAGVRAALPRADSPQPALSEHQARCRQC